MLTVAVGKCALVWKEERNNIGNRFFPKVNDNSGMLCFVILGKPNIAQW